jgi:hypothetical protein
VSHSHRSALAVPGLLRLRGVGESPADPELRPQGAAECSRSCRADLGLPRS